MTYTDIFSLVSSLSSKLHTFNVRAVDSSHTSTMFDTIARGCNFLKSNPAATSLVYDEEVFLNGTVYPVYITISGRDIFSPMSCVISISR